MFLLGDFIRVLRAADMRVSTAESLDAAAAIEHIGLSDRALLKTALGQALAKTAPEKQRFDNCFDAYFTAPQTNAPHENPSDTAAPDVQDFFDADARHAAMTRAAAQVDLPDAQLFTQQGVFTSRIIAAMGGGALDAAINTARQSGEAEQVEELERARAQALAEVRDYVARQIALRTANAGRLLREDVLSRIALANLDQSDMQLLHALVRKLAKRLASLHKRRRKKSRRGTLDLRRTIRANQRHGGMLAELIWKRQRITRPKLFVICDVSGSVAAVAQFLLLFVRALDDVIAHTRSFAFSNALIEISDSVAEPDAALALSKILRRAGGGVTDYGAALRGFCDLCLDALDQRSTVLILGDARSNFTDPGHRELQQIYQRARRVVWLNPEVKPLWNSGDSEMRRLGAYCHHVQVCNSVRHLERVMDDLLRRSV